MTAQELHIGLDFHLQKINTNATRNILPQEKDWLLNEQVSKFINTRSRKIADQFKNRGFQEDSKRLKDLQPLISKKDILVQNVNSEKGRFILPSSVFKYIRVDCEQLKNCISNNIKENTKQYRLYSFPLPKLIKGETLKINLTKGRRPLITVFDTSTLPEDYLNGVDFRLLRSLFISLQKTNTLGEDSEVEFYYENFDNINKSNTIFIKAPIDCIFSATVSNIKTILSTNLDLNLEIKDFKYYSGNTSFLAQGRVITEEMETFKVSSNLSRSLQESPLVSIQQGYGEVHYPKNTIIKQVSYVFIAKPNIIDISLNSSLNLDRAICEEIVIETSRFIKGLFDSNNYEKYLKENTLIE